MLAFSAFIVSLAVAGAAWAQVHIAQQKLVVDLFDKRYAAYEALRSTTAPLIEEGMTVQNRFAFVRASFEMEYLFGDEVVRHLAAIRSTLEECAAAERALERGDQQGGRTDEMVDRTITSEDRFYEEIKALYPLLTPYMRVTIRAPRTPKQWLSDQWSARPTIRRNTTID